MRQVLSPGDLRPIALTCRIGKAVLGGYVQRMKQCLHHRMCQLPLFAYLPRRGALVSDNNVNNLLQDLGKAPQPLRQNFVAASFFLYTCSRHLADCPNALPIEGAHYEIAHRGHRTKILTARGVRQGCKASP